MTDAELAAQLADTAGRLLRTVRDSMMLGRATLGGAGDAVANQFLVRALREQRPADAVLSEEECDDQARLSHERVWIVDPVDGTREYGECRADWAVHVGLAIGGVPVTGAVALPDARGGIVLRSDTPVPLPPAPATLRMVVSRTRPAPEAVAVATAIGAELVPMGSAGAKAMSIILGDADIYLHSGGQYEWDSCAPAAVALAHGLHASRIDGSPLVYNQADTYMPDLLICRHDHVALVRDALAAQAKSPSSSA
ncbi:3'(2'),5'-bisphosphate nucleotidase CysQ [Sphingomonas endophytica]|uniref:Inositol phosphatase n=1 Tax=Sphingomonas endophytica TaxID=869719 RepID=A0A147I6U4_9SPHN|nr:3'(2'),5'-bisphosphate nucleotidase CysQ [Sphingomonas endophytica]KTT74654.1 inositol phosphatase [Sphingomonas endophytica]